MAIEKEALRDWHRLPSERFRLYAVAARFPHHLSGQVPWQQRQEGVYDCR
jgi:hypothetical protein